MKRNATGLLGGAMVLSMLTSPPHSPPAPGGAAATVGAGAASMKNDAAKDWKPDVFGKHGRQDAADDLARVFLDVCRKDRENIEKAPSTTEKLKENTASISGKAAWYKEALRDDA